MRELVIDDVWVCEAVCVLVVEAVGDAETEEVGVRVLEAVWEGVPVELGVIEGVTDGLEPVESDAVGVCEAVIVALSEACWEADAHSDVAPLAVVGPLAESTLDAKGEVDAAADTEG